jgi:hypothetical protein
VVYRNSSNKNAAKRGEELVAPLNAPGGGQAQLRKTKNTLCRETAWHLACGDRAKSTTHRCQNHPRNNKKTLHDVFEGVKGFVRDSPRQAARVESQVGKVRVSAIDLVRFARREAHLSEPTKQRNISDDSTRHFRPTPVLTSML